MLILYLQRLQLQPILVPVLESRQHPKAAAILTGQGWKHHRRHTASEQIYLIGSKLIIGNDRKAECCRWFSTAHLLCYCFLWGLRSLSGLCNLRMRRTVGRSTDTDTPPSISAPASSSSSSFHHLVQHIFTCIISRLPVIMAVYRCIRVVRYDHSYLLPAGGAN